MGCLILFVLRLAITQTKGTEYQSYPPAIEDEAPVHQMVTGRRGGFNKGD